MDLLPSQLLVLVEISAKSCETFHFNGQTDCLDLHTQDFEDKGLLF